MTESTKRCKCATGAFTYADDSKNLKEMVKERNYHAGWLMADRLVKSIDDMEKHCGVRFEPRTIETARAIREICKDKTIMNKMSYREAVQIETLLENIEDDVVTKLQRCEGGD